MRKIRRPIEGIHVPAKFRTRLVTQTFFRGNGVRRKIFCQPIDDQSFRPLIRLRHEVHFALIRNLRRPRGFFSQHTSSGARNFDRSFKKVRNVHPMPPLGRSFIPNPSREWCAQPAQAYRKIK